MSTTSTSSPKKSNKDNDQEDSDVQMDGGVLEDGAAEKGKEEEGDEVKDTDNGNDNENENDKKRRRIDSDNKGDMVSDHGNKEQKEDIHTNSNIKNDNDKSDDTNNKTACGDTKSEKDHNQTGDDKDDKLKLQSKDTNTTTTVTAASSSTTKNDTTIDEKKHESEDSESNNIDHEDDNKTNKKDKDYVQNEDSNSDDNDDEKTETEEDDDDDEEVVKPKPVISNYSKRRSSLRIRKNLKTTVTGASTPNKSPVRRSSNNSRDEDNDNVKEDNGDGNVDEDGSSNDDDDDDNSESKKLAKKRLFKPIVDLDAGTVTFSTPAVHEQLLCGLCGGLFRDPFTISECLHTFCKTCIFFAFQDLGFVSCPRCKVSLNPDPFKFIMFDRTMQELVDKLFPELKEQDMEEEKAFFDNLDKGEDVALAAATAVVERYEKSRQVDNDEGDSNNDINSGENSRSVGDGSEVTKSPSSKRTPQNKQNLRSNDSSTSSCKTRSKLSAKKYIPPSDEMSLSLYPLKGGKRSCQLPSLNKPLLQTSGRLRIIHLKKYIIQQLSLKSMSPQTIEVRCNGDHVGDELSLTFIKKTRWLDLTKDLTLHYQLDGNNINT